MDDLFDGLDLEDLADSEGAIIEHSAGKPAATIVQPATAVTTTTQEQQVEDPNAVDFEALANLETIDTIPDSEDASSTEEGKGRASQAPATNPKGQSPSSLDAFTSFASVLKDAGVFSSLEEEDLDIKTTEDLVKAVEKQIELNKYGSLNEDQKKYLTALESGVPESEVVQSQTSAAQYKKLTEEQISSSEPLQLELMKRSFLIKGFDISAAEKFAKLAVQGDTIVEDAIQAKLALVAHEESKIQEQVIKLQTEKANQLAKETEMLEALKSKINQSSDVIPGISVNSTTKDKIFASITSPVKVDNGEPMNEVMSKYKEDPEYKLKLHALHVITKGFTDFSKFENTTKTKATKEFETILKSTGSGTTGSSSRGGSGQGTVEGLTSRAIGEALKNINF